MHNTIATVFKVLGVSIILMLIMEVSLQVVDTVTVNNRVESTMRIMQDELARNNCIPDDIAPMLDKNLRDAISKSKTAVDIKWNLDTSEKVDGVAYQPINSANVKQNGEIAYLVVKIKYQRRSIMFNMDGSGEGIKSKFKDNMFTVVDSKVIPVPMLRYLK